MAFQFLQLRVELLNRLAVIHMSKIRNKQTFLVVFILSHSFDQCIDHSTVSFKYFFACKCLLSTEGLEPLCLTVFSKA